MIDKWLIQAGLATELGGAKPFFIFNFNLTRSITTEIFKKINKKSLLRESLSQESSKEAPDI